MSSSWGWPKGRTRKEGGPYSHKIDLRVNDEMLGILKKIEGLSDGRSGWCRNALDVFQIFSTWPKAVTGYKFAVECDEKTKNGTIRWIGDHALGVNVSYKDERSAIVDIFGARVKGVEETLIREILGAAKALGLLDEEYFTGEKSWREIPLEDLDAAFRKIFGETQEIVYIESLTVQKLLRWLRQPSVTDYLGQLSDEDPSVPDYTPFSNEVFTRGR